MIESKTEKELNQLARDLHAGRIYTDRHISEHEKHNIAMVFMVLGLMDQNARQQLIDDKPGLLYEYLDEAGPRSINGMPIFTSMKVLNESDTDKVLEKSRKLDAASSKALGEEDSGGS